MLIRSTPKSFKLSGLLPSGRGAMMVLKTM